MARRCAAFLWCAAALVLAAGREAAAQVAAGTELRVNELTTDTQRRARAFVAVDGTFVVTWHSFGQDGARYGVMARRFDARGNGLGNEFQVNTYTTDDQYHPDIAADRRGNFVVVWDSFGQDGSYASLNGQRFDARGQRRGGEFQVNTYTTYSQEWGRVAVAPGGSFVVAWSSYTDGSVTSIVARRYDAQGAALGNEFVVNSTTAGLQIFPDVGVADDGSFVVAWMGPDGPTNYGVFARRFSPAGAPLGSDFRVNTTVPGYQNYPSLSVSPAGAFVVAWQSAGQDGSVYAIVGRRYDAAGVPLGAEFLVNTYTTGDQSGRPAVSADRQGNFTVAWRSMPGQDGSASGVFARRFAAGGAARSGEFGLNTYTTGDQDMPEVAVDPVGNVLSVWRSGGQDGSGSGVFARRWGGLLPAALAADSAGNGVLEPGESADVRPSWRNVNGAAQAFTGTFSNITGPAGATYTITDAAGSYGTVADGAVGPCTDCYGVSVSNPATRPVQHWDASVLESLAPDTQGQQKTWALHLGNSFSDVPSTGAFYRFIETLLHNGVTGGCGGANYCPGTVTSRDQMSVFVLVAREGAGYTPPACTTPVFNDVPASNGFCRFIEELFRRGVVTGCGGGNYCPGDPVTREQMAIFTLRTLDPALNPPACGTPVFADVPASSPFCKWIEELFRRGVVTGCGGGNYCPTQSVTRDQMGVFISVTFGLTLYGV